MKKLTYVLTGSVFLGTQILALDLGVAKLSLYRLMLLVISGLTILLVLKNDSRLTFSSNFISKNYTRFYFFWFLYALISVIWIQDLIGWLKAVFFIGCGFLSIFYLSIFIKEEYDVKNIFKMIFGMFLFHNLIGWMEILTGNYLFANLDKLDKYNTFATQPNTRIPISIFANQNDFATMLLAGMTITFILLKISNKMSIKTLYFLSLISSLILLYRTDSRANTLAFVVGIAVLIITKYSNVFSIKNISKLLIGIGGIGVIIILFSPSLQNKIITFLADFQYALSAGGNSNVTRINLIRNGFIFLIQSLGLGTGAGNIEYWMSENAIFSTGTITNMHNWWMEILTGYGVIIFTLYIFMYIMMIRQLFVNYKYSTNQFIRTVSWVFIAYMISFILSSISSASNIFIEWQWVFWGVIITFIRFSEKSMKSIQGKEEKEFNSRGLKSNGVFSGGKRWI